MHRLNLASFDIEVQNPIQRITRKKSAAQAVTRETCSLQQTSINRTVPGAATNNYWKAERRALFISKPTLGPRRPAPRVLHAEGQLVAARSQPHPWDAYCGIGRSTRQAPNESRVDGQFPCSRKP